MSLDKTPTPLPPFKEPAFVPKQILALPQWICWRAVWDADKLKWDKKPICVATGDGRGFTKIEMGSTYDDAVTATRRLNLAGVGFVFHAHNRLIGIDLDHCRDPATGVIEPWAQAIIDKAETYAEISPSGTGVHLFALGDLAGTTAIKNTPAQVEMYASGRYFTITGDHIEGTPGEVNEAPLTLAALHDRLTAFPAGPAPGAATSPKARQAPAVGSADAFSQHVYKTSFFGRINDLAMKRMAEWVRELFPTASQEAGTGAWRVKSADLGRGLEEDISLHPDGIVDFGEHDMGDFDANGVDRKGKRTPIDIVMLWLKGGEAEGADKTSAVEAGLWLCGKLKVDPRSLGYRGSAVGPDKLSYGEGESEPGPDPEAGVTAKTRWQMLREASRSWPSRDKVAGAGGDGNVARLKPGIAVFGKGAKAGPARERLFITNRLARGIVSVLNGVPGQGKTAVAVAYMNAIACEKPTLVGLSAIRRAGACVYIAADNEKADEFKRRDEAFRQRHGLVAADYKHDIYVFDEPGVFLEMVDGAWVPTLWMIETAKVLAGMRETGKLAVVVVDTLSGMAGGGKLNDDSDMQAVMAVARMLAMGLNCAVDLVNHLTKGGAKTDPESMDAGGGARALTAVPKFVTNVLAEAGGMVRLHEAKVSYRDGPQGMAVMRWGEERVPVEVWEEGVLDGVSTSAIGVLIPENPLVLAQNQENVVVQAIADAIQVDKLTVIRSNTTKGGRRGKGHVIDIVQKAIPGISAKKADDLVGTLVGQGRLAEARRYDMATRNKWIAEITLPKLVDDANI